jgi:hypothetical protein
MPLKIHLLTGPTPTELTPTVPNPTPSTPPTQLSASLAVRIHIRAFTGYPAPAVRDPEYFSHGVHKSDLFSIHFFFVPPADIPGDDLVLANTFDRPIRSRLPYFFPAAWKALKWVDPGIEGDCYADRPEVYGRVLGSANFLDCVEEDEEGRGRLGALIEEKMPPGIPQTPEARRKWFLSEEKRKEWVWRRGREYRWDFCNGMMDFNGLSSPHRPRGEGGVLIVCDRFFGEDSGIGV